MSQTKVCLHCGKRKAVSKFYVRANSANDATFLRPECKVCTASRRAAVVKLRSKTKRADHNQGGSK
jgi:hypothetical protein